MKRNFFANTMILTLTTQLLSLIGVWFIAWLSGAIGAEGIGLYQLISSVYILASTLASSGVGVTVARLIAESIAKSGGRSTSDVLRKAVVLAAVMGLIVGVALYFLAEPIGAGLLGDRRTVLSLRVLAPALPFIALSACMRGYFIGIRRVLKPSSQMIFEQLVRIGISMLILNMFLPRGLEYACLAVILACMISEAASCLYAVLMYALEKRRALPIKPEKGVTGQLVRISLPIALSSNLRSVLRTAENILIPRGIEQYGASHTGALSQFGQLGMTTPVLFFPSGLLTSVGTMLLPEVAHAKAMGDASKIRAIFSRVFRMTMVMALLFCAVYLAFAEDFGLLIYQSNEISRLLTLLAPLTPLTYLDFVVDSMMSGLGQQMRALRINILDYVIRVCLVLVLIPHFGFYSYILIMYVSAMLNATLSIRRLLIVSRTSINVLEWIIKPVVSAAVSGSLVALIFRLSPVAQPNALILTLKIILLAALYFVLLFATQCLNRDDLSWLKAALRSAKSHPADIPPVN
jgi:stage V sporulation protein B